MRTKKSIRDHKRIIEKKNRPFFHDAKHKLYSESTEIVQCLYGHFFPLHDLIYTWDEIFVCPECSNSCSDHESRKFNEMYFKCKKCGKMDPVSFSKLTNWKCPKCITIKKMA